MWLFTEDGFFSIVQKPGDKGLTIRARQRGDLVRLVHRYTLRKSSEIESGGGSDYPYRLRVNRVEARVAVESMVREIDYPNFKARVSERLGVTRSRIMERVWAVLLALQLPGASR